MATTAEKRRAYDGPILLSGGFRPFFLFGAVWAAIAVALWLPMWEGHLVLPTIFPALDWHVHELLYGYLPAAAAGFLLTAVPNWTGRLPVVGTPLAALVAIWAAGRLAIALSAWIGAPLAAAIDLAFLVALIGLIAREVIAGRNWRNLRVLALLGLLLAGNAAFHFEVMRDGHAVIGTRIGLAAAVLLVSVIGGRIVPSFTANWLRNRAPGFMPIPFGRFDGAVIVVSALALAAWIAAPDHRATAVALIVAGLAQAARLARWAGWRTGAEALLLVLHVAYLSLPLGFLLLGAANLGLPLAPSAALHAWTIGAVGLMTLAVMTRASLGHTGRAMHAGRGLKVIYVGAGVALIARIAVGFGWAEFALLHVAVLGWLVAFVGFVGIYWTILARPRA
ncbi:NnrS family protein [Siculibacillus lacustris]|uniref:NnrS family protein n=1 Tax=Siculibacillus lacustris TaxID=1549641 RepID=A0A4Q9VP07_9HYPH|nr:NnrS family protein [Siculibacillus lacustris]TBW37412.1 NnrS family protein [Siculibacillus lacustris]